MIASVNGHTDIVKILLAVPDIIHDINMEDNMVSE